jgi:hypothetical protein
VYERKLLVSHRVNGVNGVDVLPLTPLNRCVTQSVQDQVLPAKLRLVESA